MYAVAVNVLFYGTKFLAVTGKFSSYLTYDLMGHDTVLCSSPEDAQDIAQQFLGQEFAWKIVEVVMR